MKQFIWLKHNGILLINLGVIAVMLWLTISFLSLAITERSQALLLQSSANTQKSIYSASKAISNGAISLRTLSTLDRTATVASQSEFSKQMSVSAKANSHMHTLIDKIRSEKDFHLNSKNNEAKIRDLSTQLANQLAKFDLLKLSFVKDQNTAGQAPTSTENTYSFISESHRNIQQTMMSLSNGIAYLPDRSASDISALQQFVVELLTLRFEISQYRIRYGNDIDVSFVDVLAQRQSLYALNQAINKCLETINLLSSNLQSNSILRNISSDLQSWYLDELNSIQNQTTETKSIALSASYRLATNNIHTALLDKIDTLSDKGFENIITFSNEQYRRSTNNIAIDTLLILLCLIITATTILLNRRIRFLAYNDKLSGLSNRVSLENWLNQLTGPSQVDKNQKHALIYIDLDRFKAINDNYGHHFGDKLICIVANRLTSLCGKNSLVARLGGDEFGILVRDIDSESDVMTLANQMVDSVSQQTTIGEHNIQVVASAGVSFFPGDRKSGLTLLENADIAMYHNKKNGDSGAHRFNAELANAYHRRLETEVALKHALDHDEFELCYQPKVCVLTNKVKSVEALLRWKHKTRGYISPAEFVPVAEELGLMLDIGTWVLNRACAETAQVHAQNGTDFTVAINISSQQFQNDQFEAIVEKAIASNGLNRQYLELEVTESLLMHDEQRVITILDNLRQTGIKIALDDFGTGYSSLQYLQQLPLDTLKIDRAFITALDGVSATDSVANSIVQLAALFNLETVAEGVETEEQDEKVRALGVDHIQGYRYSKPVPSEDLADVIKHIAETHGKDSDIGNSNAA